MALKNIRCNGKILGVTNTAKPRLPALTHETDHAPERYLCHLGRIMETNLIKLSSRQLRALFLRESKKFLKTLDYQAVSETKELKEQMLDEIRENLKALMHLIELKEKQESENMN
jgi:hypothetical protein